MENRRAITVGIGAAALTSADVVLDLGAHHPSTHGSLRIALWVEGDIVTRAEPIVGYVHRGAEKLFEVRDYRQIMALANRHDWLSAFANELGVALAVERMLGIETPIRAVWARMLLAELNRVLAHLMFLGSYPPSLTSVTELPAAARDREILQRLMEEACGGRVHFMFNRVGGLRDDLPDGWLTRARTVVAEVRAGLPALGAVVLDDESFRSRARGIGVLPAEVAKAYGVSGPVARASGLDIDLRRDDPHLAYKELPLRVVTRTDGDVLARYECLLEQVSTSLDLADACVDRLDDLGPGDVNVRLPKVVRAPEGHTYAWTESPLGINGYYLVSRGEKTPWRLKLRTASFNNVAVLPELLIGKSVDDVAPVLASLFFVVGDIDK